MVEKSEQSLYTCWYGKFQTVYEILLYKENLEMLENLMALRDMSAN